MESLIMWQEEELKILILLLVTILKSIWVHFAGQKTTISLNIYTFPIFQIQFKLCNEGIRN